MLGGECTQNKMTGFALSTMKSEHRQLPSLFSDVSVHAQCDTAVCQTTDMIFIADEVQIKAGFV